MNLNNSIHISYLFYVYIMYACMHIGFVPEINLFVFVDEWNKMWADCVHSSSINI